MTKVYLADVEGFKAFAVFEKMYRTLPEHRKQKVDRLRYEKDKRLCVGAWLLLMHTLKEAGIDNPNIQLSYGVSGKPYLADYPELFFNLSHSGSRVLCALSDREVGCDVQKITPANRKLAQRYFCPEECQAIAAAGEQDVMFFRLWTLKESFIKNIGRGLSLPFGEFCIRLTEDGAAVRQQVLPEETFCFREFDLQDGYRYACCARKPDIMDIRIVDIEENRIETCFAPKSLG